MTTSEARVPLLSDGDLTPEQEEVLGPLIALRGEPLNIFAALANHPKLLKRWLVFGAHVLGKSTLTAPDRELLILRTAWNCGADYEFGHHTEIGLESGLTSDEVVRVTAGPDAPGWTPHDQILLRAADELHETFDLSDDTWTALQGELDTQQALDLVFAVGQYHLVAMALRSLRIPREADVPGFPERTQDV
jgi:alkylhydroperoxidase family enzyme